MIVETSAFTETGLVATPILASPADPVRILFILFILSKKTSRTPPRAGGQVRPCFCVSGTSLWFSALESRSELV
jgi:hypothetical protein